MCNEAPSVEALVVLGQVIQPYMDLEASPWGKNVADGQERIRQSLARNQLTYHLNGVITLSGSTPSTKTLADLLKAGDFSSIEVEFERAIKHLDQDPHTAITASSAIIEALCKTYIETFGLDMPTKQTIKPLWGVVLKNLRLSSDSTLRNDQTRTLQGLSSIVDGVGAYRTHIGSAHGRGISPPNISVAEARLAVNAAHSLVIFVMELWHLKEPNKALQVTANPLARISGT